MYLEVKKNMYIIFMHIAYHYNYNEGPISLASLQAYKLTGPGYDGSVSVMLQKADDENEMI